MPAGDVETFHQSDCWHNRIEGSGEIFGSHPTKEEAIEQGRDEARRRQVEHIIRNLAGQIAERHTYGHDPRDIRG